MGSSGPCQLSPAPPSSHLRATLLKSPVPPRMSPAAAAAAARDPGGSFATGGCGRAPATPPRRAYPSKTVFFTPVSTSAAVFSTRRQICPGPTQWREEPSEAKIFSSVFPIAFSQQFLRDFTRRAVSPRPVWLTRCKNSS